MRNRSIRLTAILALVAAAACASGSGGGSRSSGNVLLGEEIRSLNVQTAFEALERARPRWLRTRPSTTLAQAEGDEAVVYIDGIRVGGLDELRNLRALQVARMEFLRASDATSRFGTGHGGGAILVRTR